MSYGMPYREPYAGVAVPLSLEQFREQVWEAKCDLIAAKTKYEKLQSQLDSAEQRAKLSDAELDEIHG